MRLRCARPGCRHTIHRHEERGCSCGCQGWCSRWPHWWRNLTVGIWTEQDIDWRQRCEHEARGYVAEEAEFARRHPRPTFKAVLVFMAGTAAP